MAEEKLHDPPQAPATTHAQGALTSLPSTTEKLPPSGHTSISQKEDIITAGAECTTDENAPPLATPPQQPQHEELSRKSKIVIVLALCLCTFLAALDQTIIATAIPVLASQFQSASAYTWIGTAYFLAAAAFLPSWGKFSDIWGRKKVILLAASLFLIGSVFCAAAKGIPLMLVGRVIQGLGGGGQLGLVNVTISDMFSPRERGLYLSLLGMTWALASAIGPVLSGAFTSMAEWGWRFCFIMNLIVGPCAMFGIIRFLHLETPTIGLSEGLARVDWCGTVTVVTATVFFLLALEFGGVHYAWDSAIVLCFLIIGFALFCVFVIIEWKVAKMPLMPLKLFNNRTNACAYLVALTHGILFTSGCFFLPLFFQAVRGDGPLLSGVFILPYVIFLSIMSGVTGIIIARTGRYQELIWSGVVIMTLGFGLLADLDRNSGWAKLILYQSIAGLGAGPLFQSPLIAVQSTLEPKDLATGTTTFTFLRTIGTSLAMSLGLVVFQNRMQEQVPRMLRLKLPLDVVRAVSGSSASASVEFIRGLPPGPRVIAQKAYAYGMRGLWFLFLGISVACLILSLGIGKKHLSKQVNSAQRAVKRPKKAPKAEGGTV